MKKEIRPEFKKALQNICAEVGGTLTPGLEKVFWIGYTAARVNAPADAGPLELAKCEMAGVNAVIERLNDSC